MAGGAVSVGRSCSGWCIELSGDMSRAPVLGFEVGQKSSAARAALRGTSPLPHLLQRGHACGRGVARLGGVFETGETAVAPVEKTRQDNKADNHGLTGLARCNKCGSGLVPRSAARAALDLKGGTPPHAKHKKAPADCSAGAFVQRRRKLTGRQRHAATGRGRCAPR